MTEKFRIQVPADGIGGIIFRVRLPAQRLTEQEAREGAKALRAAADRIAPAQPPSIEQAIEVVREPVRKLKRIAEAVGHDLIVKFQPHEAPASAPKISRRQTADYSPSEQAIVNLALDLSPNPRPLSLLPRFPGRSVQWISAKLQQERAARARAQSSVPPSVGTGEDAGRALQAVPTRPPDGGSLALGNDEGRPVSALQQQIKDQVALLAEKDAEIQGLRRAKDAMIEQRLLAEKGAKDQVARLTHQLAVKDRVINRLQRAQDRVPAAQNQSWGLTRSATPMPDTGPIRLPTKEDAMKGR